MYPYKRKRFNLIFLKKQEALKSLKKNGIILAKNMKKLGKLGKNKKTTVSFGKNKKQNGSKI